MGKYVDDDVHLASVLFGGIQHIHHRPRLALKRYLENRFAVAGPTRLVENVFSHEDHITSHDEL